MTGAASQDRHFVDTSILVYAHDASAGGKHQQAKRLLERLWASGQGCLSLQVLQEFYVTITRKVPRPVDPADARLMVLNLSRWMVHAPTVDDVLGAIDAQTRLGLSFWDAMIVHSAARLGCRRLYTEDLSDGQLYMGVVAANPFSCRCD